eukprot:TRINITY_DN3024_c0_g1_i1.p2 TRINITY_DN3024_c0_g1~~TRINITY_DN3024_c0_g1_i1.p2  ORF type:complete len:214 (-),score=42.33 TRINITY_DN3024_c0_g1_i1:393-1034(-)
MGNANVMLRYSGVDEDDPIYVRVEIGQHIRWAEFRQLAFSKFRDYLGEGVDPQFLIFETVLDHSNVKITIPDGKTLRSMIEDFYRMDRHGEPAIIDIMTLEEREDERDDSSSDEEEEEEELEEAFEKLLQKKKYRRKIIEDFKDAFYSEYKSMMFEDVKERLLEEYKEQLFEEYREQIVGDRLDDMVASARGQFHEQFKAQAIAKISEMELEE